MTTDLGAAVLVLDDDEGFVQGVADVLEDHDVRHASSAATAIRAAQAGLAAVLVIGPAYDFDDSLDVLEQARQHGVALGAVLVMRRPTTAQLRRALQAQVADVLPVSHDPAELLDAVARAWPTRAPVVSIADAHPQEHGRVVTVFSPKGGAGKSTVCANLAVLLAARGKKVVVLDLDLQFGDAAIMFQAQPTMTLADAVASLHEIDAADIPNYVVHHESGVDILAAPAQPSQADHIAGGHVSAVLQLLVETYDWIVVDTPAMFTETVLSAIDASDRLIILGGFDVPSIKNMRLALATLRQLGVDEGGMQVAMTRTNAKVGLRLPEVERTMGATVNVGIPSNRSVPISLNHGVPLAVDQPKSPVVLAISELVDGLLGVAGAPAKDAEPATNGVRRRLMGRARSQAAEGAGSAT